MRLLRKHPLALFLALAAGISWPLALSAHAATREFVALATLAEYAAKFGPSLAGLLTIALVFGPAGIRDLTQSLLRWRVAWPLYIVALGLPALLWTLVICWLTWQRGETFALDGAAWFWILPLMVMRTVLGGGLGEELGWRGFMQPWLQRRHSALTAALIVGVAWGLWHAPKILWIEDAGVASMVLFTLYTCALSILFAALYNSTGGNLLLCVLLHAAFNATNTYVERLLPGIVEVDNRVILFGLVVLAAAVLTALITGRDLRFTRRIIPDTSATATNAAVNISE